MGPDAGQDFSQTFREVNAAPRDPDEDDRLAILVSLGDLVCDASEDAMEVGRIQDDDAVGHKKTESAAAGGRFGHENLVWLHAVLGELAGSP
jgi:hypothetical protein